MKTIVNRKTELLECDQCPNIFFRNIDLNNHKKHIHTEKYPFSYNSKGEKYVSCDMCSKTYPSRQNLNIHLRSHSGERPFSCKICTKNYPTQNSLTCHIKSHIGEKPYSCEDCTKPFPTKQSLKY